MSAPHVVYGASIGQLATDVQGVRQPSSETRSGADGTSVCSGG